MNLSTFLNLTNPVLSFLNLAVEQYILINHFLIKKRVLYAQSMSSTHFLVLRHFIVMCFSPSPTSIYINTQIFWDLHYQSEIFARSVANQQLNFTTFTHILQPPIPCTSQHWEKNHNQTGNKLRKLNKGYSFWSRTHRKEPWTGSEINEENREFLKLCDVNPNALLKVHCWLTSVICPSSIGFGQPVLNRISSDNGLVFS